jgi:hypothetical protein
LRLITIVLLIVAMFVLGRAVVRLENYRYANFVGLCDKFDIANPQQRLAREECLDQAQTRTHWFWHLLYGTRVL